MNIKDLLIILTAIRIDGCDDVLRDVARRAAARLLEVYNVNKCIGKFTESGIHKSVYE